MILLSIVQIVFILAAQVGITNAVREAARLAAVTTPTTTAGQATGAGSNGSLVYQALTKTTSPGGFLKRNVFAYSSGSLVTSGSPITEVCYSSYQDPSGNWSVNVKVEAYYRHPLFIPLIGAILDGIDGTSDNAFRVGAIEEMRVENEVLASNPGLGPTCATS